MKEKFIVERTNQSLMRNSTYEGGHKKCKKSRGDTRGRNVGNKNVKWD
jgi:hypothetical protein